VPILNSFAIGLASLFDVSCLTGLPIFGTGQDQPLSAVLLFMGNRDAVNKGSGRRKAVDHAV